MLKKPNILNLEFDHMLLYGSMRVSYTQLLIIVSKFKAVSDVLMADVNEKLNLYKYDLLQIEPNV